MPDRLIYPYALRMAVAGFPPKIRDAATVLIMSLLNDPVPPEAIPFLEEPGHAAYAVSNDLVTVYYTILDDSEVIISNAHPNT